MTQETGWELVEPFLCASGLYNVHSDQIMKPFPKSFKKECRTTWASRPRLHHWDLNERPHKQAGVKAEAHHAYSTQGQRQEHRGEESRAGGAENASDVRSTMWNPRLVIIYSLLKAAELKRSCAGSGESNNSGLHSSSWKDLPLPRLKMWLGQKGGDVLSVCNNLSAGQLSVSSRAHLRDCVMPAECTDE